MAHEHQNPICNTRSQKESGTLNHPFNLKPNAHFSKYTLTGKKQSGNNKPLLIFPMVV